MKKVMAFGTFDIVHEGHKHFLQEAKKLGNYLIVVVARDENALQIKGKKPVHNEQERLAGIKALSFVDEAVLGDREMRSWGVIKRLFPQIIALGYDQWQSEFSLAKELEKKDLRPLIVRMKSHRPELYKTSKLLKKVKPNIFK